MPRTFYSNVERFSRAEAASRFNNRDELAKEVQRKHNVKPRAVDNVFSKNKRTYRSTIHAVGDVLGIPEHERIDVARSNAPASLTRSQDALLLEGGDESLRDAVAVLNDARRELSIARCKEKLEKAHEVVAGLVGTVTGAKRILAVIHAEFAHIAERSCDRLSHRKSAAEKAWSEWVEEKHWAALCEAMNRTVDYYYDAPGSPNDWLRSRLADVSEAAKHEVDRAPDTDAQVLLLIQRSSVLRCQCQHGAFRQRALRRDEMLRCASLALEKDPQHAGAQLEFGQANWTVARYPRLPKKAYEEYCEEAEAALLSARDLGYPVSRLVLSRFYRWTYRARESVLQFDEWVNIEPRRRRVLREAFLLGEAIEQVWRNDPHNAARQLAAARSLLHDAVQAGYREARMLLALAKAEAASGNLEESKLIIGKMKLDEENATVDDILKMVIRYIDATNWDGLRMAFTFGLDQPAVWNSLATYVKDYLGQPKTALKLYNVALNLSENHPMLLLNKAMVLNDLGGAHNLVQARMDATTAKDRSSWQFRPFVEEFLASLPSSPQTISTIPPG